MAWYDPSWTYRAKCTANNTKVSGDITDYRFYLDMSQFGSGHGVWSNGSSTGADYRLTESDGTTEIPIEIVDLDTTGKTGWICGKADISGSTDTDYYLYYGNAGASGYAETATYGSQNVWDTECIWCHHMEEAVDALDDKSDSQVDDEASSTGTSGIAGKVGDCHEYSGSESTVFETGVSTYLRPTSAITMRALFYADATNDRVIMYHGDSTNKGWGIWLYGGYLRASIGTGNGNVFTYLTYTISGNISTGTWYHVMVTWDGSTARLFLNGSEVDSYSHSGTITYSGVSTQAFIGARAAQNKWDGKIDEVSLWNTALSTNYAPTEYENIFNPSTFWTIGAEETDTAGPTFIPKIQII